MQSAAGAPLPCLGPLEPHRQRPAQPGRAWEAFGERRCRVGVQAGAYDLQQGLIHAQRVVTRQTPAQTRPWYVQEQAHVMCWAKPMCYVYYPATGRRLQVL